MSKKTKGKTISDVALTMAIAFVPRKREASLKAGFLKTIGLSSVALCTIADNEKVAEFINKLLATPHGDSVKALIQKMDDTAPSRGLNLMGSKPSFPTLNA